MHAERALALSLGAFVLFVTSLLLPFVTASKFGVGCDGRLLSGVSSLWGQGRVLIALIVVVTGLIFPLVRCLCVAELARGALGLGAAPSWHARLWRVHSWLGQWAMADIQMLAVIIAFVKLTEWVEAHPNMGLLVYGVAAVLATLSSLELRRLESAPAAREAEDEELALDGDRLAEGESIPSSAKPGWSAAFALGAVLLLVPAYLLPIARFYRAGGSKADTILSGVAALWRGGLYGIALIVFVASLLFPLLKLVAIGVLLPAQRGVFLAPASTLSRLHHIVHAVGRWSMLDVFLMAFLCGIVQFGGLAKVQALPGLLAYAGAVIFTMLSTTFLHVRSPEEGAIVPMTSGLAASSELPDKSKRES